MGKDYQDYIEEQIQLAAGRGFASDEAEKAALYCFIVASESTRHRITELQSSDFASPVNRLIFDCAKAVVAKRIRLDIVTLMDAAAKLYPDRHAEIEKSVMDILTAETSHFVSSTGIEAYIRIIRELATRRNAIETMQNALEALKDPNRETEEVVNSIRDGTRKIETGTHEWISMQDLLISTFSWLERRAKGEEKAITTGIGNIDNLIGGFFPGEMTVIGARPGVGKSAFALNIALESAKRGYRVGIISREMTDIQFGQRILARASGIDGMKLRRADIAQDDWELLVDGMTLYGDMPITFMFSARTVEEAYSEILKRQADTDTKLDIIIVDYLQLLNTQRRFKDEHLRVGYISHTLKDIATDCHVPVIALAQVNRDSDGSLPQLKNLKDSGDIEQDADGIIFLHKPRSKDDEYIDPRDREYFDGWKEKKLTYICINVAKQRQGTVGMACVLFDSARSRYTQIERLER